MQSKQLLRKEREFLVKEKWICSIIKGWYLVTKPNLAEGDSSVWYASFWDFLRLYLHQSFGSQYCLSAENSLDLHTASMTIPLQVVVISEKGGRSTKKLPFQTSLSIYLDPSKIPQEKTVIHGLQIMTLPYALCKVSPTYFQKKTRDLEIALRLIRSSSELSSVLLKYGFKSAAERLLGFLEFLGNKNMVFELKKDLVSSGWKLKKESSFLQLSSPISSLRIRSPYVERIFSLWKDFREKIVSKFPSPTGLPKNQKVYLSHLEDLYKNDAYNSLSIEGYQIDDSLLKRVQNDGWNPDNNPQDRDERNALAARG